MEFLRPLLTLVLIITYGQNIRNGGVHCVNDISPFVRGDVSIGADFLKGPAGFTDDIYGINKFCLQTGCIGDFTPLEHFEKSDELAPPPIELREGF